MMTLFGEPERRSKEKRMYAEMSTSVGVQVCTSLLQLGGIREGELTWQPQKTHRWRSMQSHNVMADPLLATREGTVDVQRRPPIHRS